MPIPYQTIAKMVALRAMQIEGGDAAARNAALAAADVSTIMDGVEVPHEALKMDILAVEKELVESIGNTNNSIYRSYLAAASADLVTGSPIPILTNFNLPFVGVFDGIFDATDDLPLTEKSKIEVLRRVQNQNGMFVLPSYHFCFEGQRIFHTRPAVYLLGCAFNESDAESEYDSQGSSILPAALTVLWVCKVLAALPQESWFIQEATYYRGFVAEKENAVIQGKIQELQMPQLPATTARIEREKD